MEKIEKRCIYTGRFMEVMKWTRSSVVKEAKKYLNKTDFQNKSPSAYYAARKYGWYKKVCRHMKDPSIKWDRDAVLKEAKKYQTKSEFQAQSRGAYSSACKNRWLDKACAHMVQVGDRYKRGIYAYEFPDKSVYVGLTYNYKKRHEGHLRLNEFLKERFKNDNYKHITFNKFYPVQIAKKKEKEKIEEYKKKGWVILNRAKPGGVGGGPRKWTEETIKKEASKYKTLKDLRENASGLKSAAECLGIYGEIIKGMERKINPNNYWSEKRIFDVAKKCKTKIEFFRRFGVAYISAKRLGVFDKACKHMVKPTSHLLKWTPKKIKIAAKKSKSKTEFHRKYAGAYSAAKRYGIIEEIIGLAHSKRKPYSKSKNRITAKTNGFSPAR